MDTYQCSDMQSSALVIPRISIVTPSYNQGEYLEECIDSILSQNYPNLEYIIMDGGSSDNSVEIIKKYEKYLTYWQSKPDGGQYEAINEGFKKTTGDIMAWLNSDDKYHHHAFFKVAHIFNTRQDIEWLTARTALWDKDGNVSYVLGEFLPAFSRQKYLDENYKKMSIQQESTFWRRTLWERAGDKILTDMNYAGDLELWIRFFRFTQLYTVDTLLGGFRKHGDQKTGHFISEYYEEADVIIKEELELIEQGQYTEVLPTPDPIIISYTDVNSFIDSLYARSQHNVYKISDNTEIIRDSILRLLYESEADRAARLQVILDIQKKYEDSEADRAARLQVIEDIQRRYEESEADRSMKNEMIHDLKRRVQRFEQPEEIVKEALVIFLKKLHLYQFYVKHEPTFSRIYYSMRRTITHSRVPIVNNHEPAITNVLPEKSPCPPTVDVLISSPKVEALVECRGLEGGLVESALTYLFDQGANINKILCVTPTFQNIQALYMLSMGGTKVTCLDSRKHLALLKEYGFITIEMPLPEWLRGIDQPTLAEYDALLLDAQTLESDLLLLKTRLVPKSKILLTCNSTPHRPLMSEFGAPNLVLGDLMIYSAPTGWLDPFHCDTSFYSLKDWPWKRSNKNFPAKMPSGRDWPKISIVTVTLNQGCYLEETIRSVLMQNYPNLEYIVIDGGSTDNTLNILNRYQSEFAHCISEKDKGQSDALNKGFSLATGEIFAWLNSDDCYLPGSLWRVALAFDTYNADIVAGGCAIRHGDDPYSFKTHHNAMPIGHVVPLPLDRLLDIDGCWQKGDFFYQPEVFWTKNLWVQSGSHIAEHLFYSMDYELWVRFAKCGARICHAPETFTLFRLHENQKTSGDDMPFLPELRKLNAELKQGSKLI